ncbi:peptidase T [Peptostreptococcus anaerobius]|uniref:peptidase T n=1 Tax=Peptostreptococcus anaerobius TaxID=1261 RepID=UPI00232C0E0E|nr:peptidase T [Peptostreptococcus anaerobius]MDB8822080.1 peptidase T [Peptostreptococcus anaerobius]MDB8826710.1 peptidase T [Peptostreptococcus anaerobius]MDB8828560.1 peptidase T [Peptostreptococcus anaerobius]MDB8830362.1 peptidase T [Peptostreptococcus anaerobius]MDB8832245.1 peptidase T [Peptostreptococcus anaerobius]
MRKKVLSRFLNYISIDTQSDPYSETVPSTMKQFDLAKMLVKEMEDMGLEDVTLDDKCYIMAKLPANTEGISPIGFIAHMDTSPDISGKDVKPRIIENYDGKDIVLNEEKGIVTSLKDYPEIERFKGQTVIVTDGNTLLGADDKAGIAEILTGVEYLIAHPEIKHGDIMIGFTPDEEIGCGADHFDVEKFGAKYAYTFDGGEMGELEYENFNAASAIVTIKGRNVHPGSAKNKMINSIYISAAVMEAFPKDERPETTEGYEGFYHLNEISGNAEDTVMTYIIRDHDMDKFKQKKEFFQKTIDELTAKFDNRISVEIKDSYYNMREIIEKNMFVVDIAVDSMKDVGVEPNVIPIRGGTDGARLSFMGLPCPNLFAGGINFHGRNEMVSVEALEAGSKLLVRIAEKYAEMGIK